MNICEECGREFKTPQALGAHRVLYHRVSDADLETARADHRQKDQKIAELEADAVQQANRIRILEVESQASACPHCGKPVGWSSLTINECPLKSYERGNPGEWCLIFGKVEMVKYRRCPNCGYFEKV